MRWLVEPIQRRCYRVVRGRTDRPRGVGVFEQLGDRGVGQFASLLDRVASEHHDAQAERLNAAREVRRSGRVGERFAAEECDALIASSFRARSMSARTAATRREVPPVNGNISGLRIPGNAAGSPGTKARTAGLGLRLRCKERFGRCSGTGSRTWLHYSLPRYHHRTAGGRDRPGPSAGHSRFVHLQML